VALIVYLELSPYAAALGSLELPINDPAVTPDMLAAAVQSRMAMNIGT
jgi:hypothetical protein